MSKPLFPSPSLSRRGVMRSAAAAALLALAGCSDTDDDDDYDDDDYDYDDPSPSSSDAGTSDSPPGPLTMMEDAVGNAVSTLGAPGSNANGFISITYTTNLPEDADLTPLLEATLEDNRVTSAHPNYDLIRNLLLVMIAAKSKVNTGFPLSESRPLLDSLLESAYLRSLGACERNEPTCDIDIMTRFKPPGSPGGAPDWVTAWWGFSSPD